MVFEGVCKQSGMPYVSDTETQTLRAEIALITLIPLQQGGLMMLKGDPPSPGGFNLSLTRG